MWDSPTHVKLYETRNSFQHWRVPPHRWTEIGHFWCNWTCLFTKAVTTDEESLQTCDELFRCKLYRIGSRLGSPTIVNFFEMHFWVEKIRVKTWARSPSRPAATPPKVVGRRRVAMSPLERTEWISWFGPRPASPNSLHTSGGDYYVLSLSQESVCTRLMLSASKYSPFVFTWVSPQLTVFALYHISNDTVNAHKHIHFTKKNMNLVWYRYILDTKMFFFSPGCVVARPLSVFDHDFTPPKGESLQLEML